MSIYNLLEYSKNYRKTRGSLWNYYRDEPNSETEGNINYSIFKSFKNIKSLKKVFQSLLIIKLVLQEN